MNSFYEISGHIVQCDTESLAQQSLLPNEEMVYVQGARGVPHGARRQRESNKPTIEEYGSVPGRMRRARMAFGIAGTMAMVDGPLPIGDAVGIAVLIGYGSYEIYKSSEILSRAVFS